MSVTAASRPADQAIARRRARIADILPPAGTTEEAARLRVAAHLVHSDKGERP